MNSISIKCNDEKRSSFSASTSLSCLYDKKKINSLYTFLIVFILAIGSYAQEIPTTKESDSTSL